MPSRRLAASPSPFRSQGWAHDEFTALGPSGLRDALASVSAWQRAFGDASADPFAWAARTGACIIEDDYDGEYRHDIVPIPPLQTVGAEAVIYVGTLSKTLSPTLRLGYLVVPTSLCQAFSEAKRLTDRHTPLLEQDALADLLVSGAYERHVRSIRRKNTERRAVLLQALADHLGPAVTIAGADTGLHVVIWIDGVAADREPEIVGAARAAGVGLYHVSPLYDPAEPRPAAAGFVLGYAGLDADALRCGVAVLASVLAEHC